METWDVEYFLKALEEIYAVSEVDKFSDACGVWRALMAKLQSTVQVEYSNAGALSLSCTAVLLEANNRHLPQRHLLIRPLRRSWRRN